MEHQQLLQNPKYRNWVKGGLAFKYFRDGIEQFADDVVKTEHTTLLQRLGLTSTQACTSCNLTSLTPRHKNNGRTCPLNQKNCNCLYPSGKTRCPKNVCGRLYDEIVLSHTSLTPCWKNGNINQWCSDPWEMAKCYINTSGYDGKQGPAEIDITGILQMFINCTHYHQHLPSQVAGLLPLMKTRRNSLFHSTSVELEEQDLKQWVADMIDTLKHARIYATTGAKIAISNLEKLKSQAFIITINHETEACKEALAAITQKTQELADLIQKSNEEFADKHRQALSDIAEKQDEFSSKEQELKEKQREAIESFSEEAKKITAEMQENNEASLQKLQDKMQQALQERLSQVEKICLVNQVEIQKLKQCMNEYAEEMVHLKEVKTHQKEHLTVLEGRTRLRQKLKELFQKHYTKISACPLKARENEVNINDVYVWPLLKREEENTSSSESSYTERTQSYKEIFEAKGGQHKRIYITGDVGSGKTVFCQRMMSSWSNPHETLGEQTDLSFFEFLFYIPLRRLQKKSKIREMIQLYYKELASADVLNDVLDNMAERCLVLADGLDEWVPGPTECQPMHRTHELPDASDSENITLLTTSRPSAPGILKIRATESDVHLKLSGITYSSVKTLVNNYVCQLKRKEDTEKQVEIIMENLCLENISNLKQNPLLLHQIVWLLCNNRDIGSSQTDVYCSLLNVALQWGEYKDKPESPAKNRKIEGSLNIHLPKRLKNYPSCRKNAALICGLSKVAFKILVRKEGSEMAFGRYQMNECGIDDDLLDALLHTGLLREETCFDPTQEATQFSFIHTSFLEFFAVVYIVSNSGPEHSYCEDYLIELFKNVEYAEDILQLENTLIFACGFNSEVTKMICQKIYNVLSSDDKFVAEIIHLLFTDHIGQMRVIRKIDAVQNLFFRCVSECKQNDATWSLKIPFVAIYTEDVLQKIRDYVDPLSVLYIFVSGHVLPEHIKVITKFANLQSIRFDTFLFQCKGQDFRDLLSFITGKKTLRRICLAYSSNSTESVGVLDLSGHVDLLDLALNGWYEQSIPFTDFWFSKKLARFKFIETSSCTDSSSVCYGQQQVYVGPSNLKRVNVTVNIFSEREFCELLTCINNSVELESLQLQVKYDEDITTKKNNCVVDLSRHGQLQTFCYIRECDNLESDRLSFHLKTIPDFLEIPFYLLDQYLTKSIQFKFIDASSCMDNSSVSYAEQQEYVGPFNLKRVNVTVDSFPLKELCELFTCLSNSVELQSLELRGRGTLRDARDYMTNYNSVIDLSRHRQLQTLCSYSIRALPFRDINTTSLEKCTTDSLVVLKLISHSRLKHLEWLCKTYTKDVNDAIQTLHQLRELELKDTHIQDFSLEITGNMNCIKDIQLLQVVIKFRCWRKFLQKLCLLKQSVTVTLKLNGLQHQFGRKGLGLFPTQANRQDFVDFVSNKPKRFKVFEKFGEVKLETVKDQD